MKILILSINFMPELTGIGKYTGEMAEWLAAREHDVLVITAPPYYPQWRLYPGYSAARYHMEQKSNWRVIRCPLWVPRQPNPLPRILHLLSFALSSFPVLLWQSLRWRPQVILTVEPPLVCAPSALLAAALVNAKPWLHVQDFELDAAFKLGLLKNSWVRGWGLSVERFLLRHFDRISTISMPMLDRLKVKGVPETKCLLFKNWVDTETIFPRQETNQYRSRLRLSPHQIAVLYAGNIGRKQGLEILLQAASKLQDHSEIQFVICGEGSARARIQAKATHLPHVHFLPLQPVEQLNELLNLADIHLLIQRAESSEVVMPSKLTGMLASGRSIVATTENHSPVSDIVQQCGRVVPPDNPDRLASAILELASDPEMRTRLGKVARAYAAEHLHCENVLVQFEDNLKKCCYASLPPQDLT